MGTLTDAYCGFVDDTFHRRRFDRIDRYVAEDYRVVDLFRPDRTQGRAGVRAYGEQVAGGIREVRYEVVDAVEVRDRLATRYVVTGRTTDGQRVAVSGLSLHHGNDGRLARSWHVADQRDLGIHSEDDLPGELADRWMVPVGVDIGPLGSRHRQLVDRLYGASGAVADDVLDPDYLPFDPFADRIGPGGTRAINRALARELTDVSFHILDAFEDDQRLATRFAVRGRRGGRTVTVAGVSLNRFRGDRITHAWIYARYGGLSELARRVAAGLAS